MMKVGGVTVAGREVNIVVISGLQKLDGYRAQAIKNGNSVMLISRNGNPLKYPNVCAAVGQLAAESVVLDCELVALEQNGRPSFQALQNSSSKDRSICLYAFDVLHLNGYNLRALPFETRKQIQWRKSSKVPRSVAQKRSTRTRKCC
jgi:ATP-dependent DNA ligase